MNLNSKKRLNKYDNLKGVAILLIVLMHFDFLRILEPYGNQFFVLINVPLFFFIAGYFSKTGPDEPVKNFKRLLLPYIIFCIIYKIFGLMFLGTKSYVNIFIHPDFALWFLLALFFMKMSLPIVEKFRYPFLVSIICSLLFGFINMEPNILAVTRTFGYFPIFMLGFKYKDYKNYVMDNYPKIADYLKNNYVMILILIAFVIITIFGILSVDDRFFYLKYSYSGDMFLSMIKRAVVLFLAMGWVLILHRFMPERSSFLTKFGRNSMAVYVLHGFIRQTVRPGLTDFFSAHTAWFPIFLVVITFAVTFVLSRDIVNDCVNKLTVGIYNLIMKSDKPASS